MPDFTDKLKPQYDGAAIIAKERQRSQINVDELSNHLFSRDGFLERQSLVLNHLEHDPLFSKANNLNYSRPLRFKIGLARTKKLRRLASQHDLSPSRAHSQEGLGCSTSNHSSQPPHLCRCCLIINRLVFSCHEQPKGFVFRSKSDLGRTP